MKASRLLIVFVAACLFAPAALSALELGQPAGAVKLTTLLGTPMVMENYAERPGTAVLFLSARCPATEKAIAEINKLHQKYRLRNVLFVGVCSNPAESGEELRTFSQRRGLIFPVERDPAGHRGAIRGRGRDSRTNSAADGEVRYVLIEEQAGAVTRVDLEVGYALTGALAQFSRAGIVNDLAERLTTAFAKNVEARLGGGADSSNATAPPELNAGSLILSVVRARIKRFFDRLLGR